MSPVPDNDVPGNGMPQDGLVAVVKRDCPTCVMTAPVLGELARRAGLTVFTQDDPTFPETVPARDADLGARRLAPSQDRGRADPDPLRRRPRGRRAPIGWDRGEWERLTGITGLGHGLPESQPGLRRQECRARRHRTPQGPLQRDRAQVAPHRDRRRTRTSRRPCSSAAGRTACRWCRRPRSASCACSTAPRATRTRSSGLVPPALAPARSRRSRSTP